MRAFRVFLPNFGLIFVVAADEASVQRAIAKFQDQLRTEGWSGPYGDAQVSEANDDIIRAAGGAAVLDEGGNQLGSVSGQNNSVAALIGLAGGDGTGDGTGDGYGTQSPEDKASALAKARSEIEGANPLAAYYRALGPQFGDISQPGVFNQQLRQSYSPALATFLGREATGQNPTAANDEDRRQVFQNFSRERAGAGLGFSGMANQAFRDIQGGGGPTGVPDAVAGFLNPEDDSDAFAGYDLARAARRGRVSSLLDRFMPRSQDLYASWLGETGGAPVQGNNWFDYLQKRLGVYR